MISLRKIIVLIAAIMLIGASLVYVFATQLQPSSHGIGLLKMADSFAYIGDFVEYHIQVYNPSDYDLYNINITDPMLELNDTIPFLEARNMTGKTYTFHREVLDTDPNPLVNEVFVEAVDSSGAYSSSSTQAVTVIAERTLTIDKVGPEYAQKGETIKYSITVNNIGQNNLTDVIVEDELLGFSWQGDLNAGETNIFNLTYRIPCCIEGNLTNTATAWAQLNETSFYAEAAWTTKILHPCIYPHSKGYWKNHAEAWPVDWIEIGDLNYTKEEAIDILESANSKDATQMLAAQLIAAKLNRLAGARQDFCHCDEVINIDEVIEDADEFLLEYPLGSDPQDEARQNALKLKDWLDAYNNSECD
ncbi:MAG: DUF11 domain-containing protein [Candidatus Bathyarchaeota archaeon]|nr:MAG: DUF11 domain-containing protein [Candidatus Bathyarchaeota archaeon]